MKRFEATGQPNAIKDSSFPHLIANGVKFLQGKLFDARKQTNTGDYFLDSRSSILVYLRLPNLKSASLSFIAAKTLRASTYQR